MLVVLLWRSSQSRKSVLLFVLQKFLVQFSTDLSQVFRLLHLINFEGKVSELMALKAGICTALTEETLAQLIQGGVKTASDFLIRDPEQLSQELRIAYKDICSIRHVLLAGHSAITVSAASLYQSALTSLAILTTGSESLDHLLDGGLYTGELTEIAGDTAAGKTQVCMWSTAATVKLPGQSVIYIDTGSAFSAQCVLQMLAEGQQHDDAVTLSQLENIRYVQVYDIFDLFSFLDSLILILNEQSSADGAVVKLVIVDNLATLVYPVMGENIGLSQGLLSDLGLKLKKIAVQFSLVVLVTNSMAASFNGSERKPALGKAWSHVPQTRLIIRRGLDTLSGDPSLREVCLVKSSRQQTPFKVIMSLNREASHSGMSCGGSVLPE